MEPQQWMGILLLLLLLQACAVLGLRECVDQAGPSCVPHSEAQCGHAHPRLSPTARLCLKSCGLCLEGPPPVCAQGYFDPGLDTCVPCSTRCHGAANCRRQLTCPQGCPPGRHGYRCQRRCPPGCPASCDRWSGLCTEGCRHGRHGDWCHKSCPPPCHSSGCSQATGRCRARRRQPAAIHRRAVSWCRYNCRNRKCDPVTGVCTEGCVDEYRGENCTEFCPAGCRFPRRCEQYTGRCLEGCFYSYNWGEDCSLRCPSGCSNATCNQTTGACLEGCNNGYNNAFCAQECAPGRWGESCDKPCPPGCVKAACLQLSGRCHEGCQDGHWGPSCALQCPSGCRACDQDSGHCQECGTGRWGERCQHACPPDCRDGSCLQDTGHCQACPEGLCGSHCNDSCSPSTGQNTQCPQHCQRGQCHPSTPLCSQGCEKGYWSGNCSKNCSEGCKQQRCNQTDGVCTEGCKPRWHGERCEHKCSTNCKDGKCHDTDTGVQCTRGCEEGYTGVYCQEVRCEKNHYRVNTTTCMPCPQNCAGGRCDEENGLCTDGCQRGFHGDKCEAECSAHCEECERNSGDCSQCQPGYYGASCHSCPDTCQDRKCRQDGSCTSGCERGFWGVTCNLTCTPPCLQCGRQTGDCTQCGPGYYGASCQSCSNNCRQGECHHNGSCSEGCVDGFSGDRCSERCRENCQRCQRYSWKCEACQPGFYNYGGTCYSCPQHCNNRTCKDINGECEDGCVSGHWGPKCYRDCPTNCMGGHCNSTSGECTAGCQVGYRGPDCRSRCPSHCRTCAQYGQGCSNCQPGFYSAGDTCTRCPPNCHGVCNALTGACRDGCQTGKYGSHCQHNCTANCRHRDCQLKGQRPFCSKGCQDGFKGDYCQEKCPAPCLSCDDRRCVSCRAGVWGDNCTLSCTNCVDDTCSKDSGICREGCAHGFHGDRCDRKCSSGCQTSPEGDVLCNRTNGGCLHGCLPGWRGDNCTDPCQDGRYGQECGEKCGSCQGGQANCGKRDGECSAGCLEGFVGKACLQAAPPGMSDTAKAGVGVAVSLLLLLAALLIYLLVIRPRRKRMPAGGRQDYQLVSRDLPPNGVAGPSSPSSASRERNGRAVEDGGEAGVAYANAGVARTAATGVAVPDLRHYVSKAKASGQLAKDFEGLPRGLIAAHTVADLPKNKSKNRYKNICAYDSSRVVLKPEPSDSQSTDYINACYISGYKNPKKYIAVQGPVPPMVQDFWQMLWQLDVGKVVMLTNLVEESKMKCMQYWPSPGNEAVQYGAISIRCREEVVLADFTVRTLEMQLGSKSPKTVTQFHFTSWPDRGVPHDLTTLLEFHNKVQWSHCSALGPLVIHCSAGIGRTGTYIALDQLLEEAKGEGAVNVRSCVLSMRQQRVNMVQTEEQYVFLHEVLSLGLLSADTTVPASDFPQYLTSLQHVDPTGSLGLAAQFQLLQELTQETTPADCHDAMALENASKNRRPDILPPDMYRPYLTHVGKKGDYINAVSLPTYLLRKGLILTQAPLQNTVEDIFRLITDHDCRAVIVLNDTGAEPEGKYWPDVGSTRDFDTRSVTTVEKEDNTFGDVYSVEVTEKERGVKTKVKLCVFGGWPPSMPLPPSPHLLLELLEETEERKSNNPVVVHCMDGNERSGLLCVLQAVLERVKMEQEVAIFQTVHQLRLYRPQLITSLEQYRFLHDCVQAYIDANCDYTNFSSIRTHLARLNTSPTSPDTPLLADTQAQPC